MIQWVPMTNRSCPTNFTAPQCRMGEANAKERSNSWLGSIFGFGSALVSVGGPQGLFYSPRQNQAHKSEASNCQSRGTGSASLTIKKNIFKSWRLFRGRKVCLQKPQKHHNQPRKNHAKTIKNNQLFSKPPAKTPSCCAKNKCR